MITIKTWNTFTLNNVLPVVDKIISVPIPLNDIHDEIIQKFTSNENFLVKIVTWTYKDQILPHHRTKLLNSIQKLHLIHKINIFASKLIRGKIPTRNNLKEKVG